MLHIEPMPRDTDVAANRREFTSEHKGGPLNPKVYREGSRGQAVRRAGRIVITRHVYLYTNDDGLISARGRDLRIMGVTNAKNAGRP